VQSTDQDTAGRGLTSPEAASLLAEQGANEVPAQHRHGVAWRAARQLSDPMLLLLVAAGVLTTWQGDLADTTVIAMVLVVNTAVGVVQELRAERAVGALRQMAAPLARVVRDGRQSTVAASTVVRGDVVVVEAGDVVPADAELLEAHDLAADESAVTGESFGVAKRVGELVLAGTTLTRGRGRAVVTATGAGSTLGRIAGLVASATPGPTPLQRRLTRLGQQLTAAAVTAAGVVMALSLARGLGWQDAALQGASLAVAAVPESLPAVLTLSLALGARRMARHAAIARELRAVETLGSVTLLATDKTGTLTENRMVVVAAWTPTDVFTVTGEGYSPHGAVRSRRGSDPLDGLHDLARDSLLCNDADLEQTDDRWRPLGDPTEAALVAFAARAGLAAAPTRSAHPRTGEVPFDSDRGWMLTVHASAQGDGGLTVVKGGPERLLARMRAADDAWRASDWCRNQAVAGRRVLVVAEAPAGPDGDRLPDLRLVGAVAMTDPPRRDVPAVVSSLRAAGIRLAVMTGDQPATAATIAREVGLSGAVVDAAAEGALDAADADVAVFARVRPEHKLALVRRWQQAGEVVAVTGDGVNDGPALRRADIGVAMGSGGTEVARQAADLVLTDDRLETVVHAVEEGRRIHDNLRRFLGYALGGGVAEVAFVLVAPFLGFVVPLLPGQILWVNMLTHGLPGVAMGAEPAARDVLQRRPLSPGAPVLDRPLLRRVALTAALIATATLVAAVVSRRLGDDGRTAAFLVLGLAQLGVALALREPGSTRRGLFLTVAVAGAAALQAAAVVLTPLQDLLHTVQLSTGSWSVALALAAAPGLVLRAARSTRLTWGAGGAPARPVRDLGPSCSDPGASTLDGMTTQLDLTEAVDLARLAPSVHNTQPWRFRSDDGTLTLSRDPALRLPALDPTGRQQVVSCGAAMHLAVVALRLQGYDTQVVPFPPLADEHVVARLVPVPGHPVSSEDVVLADAARHRHTQRGPFEDRAVPRDVVAEILAAGEAHGAWVRVVDDQDDLVQLTVLLARADADELDDAAYQEELARWTARPASTRDGVPAAATPDVRGRASNLRLRDFTGHGAAAASSDEPPAVERQLALVLGTEQDTEADWLRAGEALMALLLRASVEGVQAQPLGQVVDREWSRARLGAALGLVGHPQMVLRLGYAKPGPDTPRRAARDIVD
jgi:P-type Ca2+ transporter type 2C